MSTDSRMASDVLATSDAVLPKSPGTFPAGRRPRSSALWWCIATIATLIVVAPYAWLPLRREPATAVLKPAAMPVVPTSLGFSVVREDVDWKLTWNREAIAKLQPVGAILSIRDGALLRQSFLAPNDLSNAIIL